MNFKRTLSAAVAAVMAAGTIGSLGITAFAATTVTTADQLRAAVAEGGEITLGANIDLGTESAGTLTVAEGTTVTIDLGKYEIKLDSDIRAYEIDGGGTEYAGYNAIINYGTLTLNGGSIVGSWQGMSNEEGGTLTVNGTSISTTGPWNGIWNGGTATINSGTVEGEYGGIYNSGDGSLTIENGTFNGNTVGIESDGDVVIANYSGDEISIWAGNVELKGGTIVANVINNESGVITVTGDTKVAGISGDYTVNAGVTLTTNHEDWAFDAETGTLTVSGFGPMKNFYNVTPKYTDELTYHGITGVERSEIKHVVIEEGITSVGNYVFYKLDNLESIVIPEGVTYIGEYALASDPKLTSVVLPSTVKTIGERAFSGDNNLESINLPESTDSIGTYAFSGCSSLKEIDIPSGVTLGTNSFLQCSSLESVTIPGDATVNNEAFRSCTGLKTVVLEEGITRIASNMFNNCSSLESITIPSTVKTIEGSAFYQCSALESVTIPEGVETIGSGAFSYCTNLTSVTVPSTVTSIGNGSFSSTSADLVISYNGTAEEWSELSGSDNVSADTEVHYNVMSATVSGAIAKHEGDDPVGATGFLTTITGSLGSSVKSVTWTVISNEKSYEFTPSEFTTLTLDSDASVTVALIIDGLFDANATATAEVN